VIGGAWCLRGAFSTHTILRLLEPHLEPVDLPARQCLARRDARVEHVYLPDCGVAAVAAKVQDKLLVLGLIGREGMSGGRVFRSSES
jgi:hypothetical protein